MNVAVAAIFSLTSLSAHAVPMLTTQSVDLPQPLGTNAWLPEGFLGESFKLTHWTNEEIVSSTLSAHPRVFLIDSTLGISTGIGPECAQGCGIRFDLDLLNPFLGVGVTSKQVGANNSLCVRQGPNVICANYTFETNSKLVTLPFVPGSDVLEIMGFCGNDGRAHCFSQIDIYGIVAADPIPDDGGNGGNTVSSPGTFVLFTIGAGGMLTVLKQVPVYANVATKVKNPRAAGAAAGLGIVGFTLKKAIKNGVRNLRNLIRK